MKLKKQHIRLLMFIIAAAVVLIAQYAKPSTTIPAAEGKLIVHYLDVGQADCILLEQNSAAMLIDAGNNGDAELILDYLTDRGIQKLDYVVGTHPHEDHIGSLDTVIRNFEIGQLLMPKVETNTKTFEDVLDAAINKNLTITAPSNGDTFPLGTAVVTAVNALEPSKKDLNNASIMLRVDFGETSFLFSGDAEAEAEEAAIRSGANLRADVLKVGHHGSRTSSSPEYLAAVKPAYAIISCGTDNDYGHPHKETLKMYADVKLYRTDKDGHVVVECDGKNLAWHTEKER